MQYKCHLFPRMNLFYFIIFACLVTTFVVTLWIKFLLFFFFAEGKRVLQMDDRFFTGYRKTALKPEEILLSIEIPYTKKVCFRTTQYSVIACTVAMPESQHRVNAY